MTQRFDSYFVLMKFSIFLVFRQQIIRFLLTPEHTLLRVRGQVQAWPPNI